MGELVAILVPLGLCVVLPIMVVWLVTRVRSKKIDRNAEVLLKALENGQEINPELLLKPSQREKRTTGRMLLEKLQVAGVFCIMGITMTVLSCTGVLGDNANVGFPVFLLCGVIFASIGIGSLITYLVGRKTLKKEIDDEVTVH